MCSCGPLDQVHTHTCLCVVPPCFLPVVALARDGLGRKEIRNRLWKWFYKKHRRRKTACWRIWRQNVVECVSRGAAHSSLRKEQRHQPDHRNCLHHHCQKLSEYPWGEQKCFYTACTTDIHNMHVRTATAALSMHLRGSGHFTNPGIIQQQWVGQDQEQVSITRCASITALPWRDLFTKKTATRQTEDRRKKIRQKRSKIHSQKPCICVWFLLHRFIPH
jgi:hypothetical protein